MLTIRFHRTGRRNYPSFKIVITEHTKSSTGGRFIEEVGFFNPATKEKVLKPERLKYWISVGAQPSPTVWNLLVKEKIVEGTKLPKHKKPKSAPEGRDLARLASQAKRAAGGKKEEAPAPAAAAQPVPTTQAAPKATPAPESKPETSIEEKSS
ncbi:MAG: 30S ribosomal protein S16 [Candidatus Wildermuthbacteria bacterium]|nr:30S ribosomal protein S16 [Candidatus Wildermuthbacteria bacterium]